MAAGRWLLPLLPLLMTGAATPDGPGGGGGGVACGGTLAGRDSGVLQTPGFPGPYPVPLRCTWVLDASHRQEPSIALYLTQLYLLSGLTVTQYAYYEREDFHMGEQQLLAVSEQNALSSRVVVAHSPYLVVRLTAQRLEGNQLRALPHLLTVFGFNITWEARDGSPEPWRACSVADCSLAGSCLAAADFKSFGCHCFEGHFGEDCGRGPGCSDANNPCRNGATCRHTGWHPEPRCLCRPGYAGPHCETRLQAANTDCPAPAATGAACAGAGADCTTGDRLRYTISVRQTGNSTVSGLTRHQLERQMQKYLRNASSSRMEHFRLLSTGSFVGELSFQWVGPRVDDPRYRETLSRAHQQQAAGGHQAGPGAKWLEVNLQHMTLRTEPTLRMVALSTAPAASLFPDTEALNSSSGGGGGGGGNSSLAVEVVSEGEPFTLTCAATGSTSIKFHWVKDGLALADNDTRASKWLWTRVEALGGGRYQSQLHVRSAVQLHAGRYTCGAQDWEARGCIAVQLGVRRAPQVRVAPMASTLRRGDNLTVTCLALGEPPRDNPAAAGRGAAASESLGFTWTRNRALLPLSPGKEVWEDLVPAGTLLRLYNVRRTATYCCQVRGRTLSRTACSDVHVVGEVQGVSLGEAGAEAEAGAVPVCAGAEAAGLWWPDTAAGAEARLPCPPQYTGRAAVRACGLVDTRQPRWAPPDFALCESRQLAVVRERLEAVTLGLSNASAAGVLSSALSLAAAALRLPGEGGALLGLLRGAAQHLADLPRQPPAAATAPVLSADAAAHDAAAPPSPKASTAATSEADQIRKLSLEGLDLLLRRPRALNSEQHVVEMQRLARSVSLLWAASPQVAAAGGAAEPERLSLPAMAVSVASVTPDPHDHTVKVHFPAPASRWADWTEGFVDVVLRLDAPQQAQDNQTLAAPGAGALGLAVVAYRNLSKLLPERLIMKQENDEELEMEIHSRVVSVWLGSSSGAVITEPPEGFLAEAWLRSLDEDGDGGGGGEPDRGRAGADWVEVCGLTSEVGASYTGAWDLTSCVLHREPERAPLLGPGTASAKGTAPLPGAAQGQGAAAGLGPSASRCACSRPGTIALLLVAHTAKAPAAPDSSPPLVVVAGCGSCLLLSLLTLVLLLLRCRLRPRALYLKLQCCAATVAAMAVFLHAVHRPPPPSCFAALATTLEALLLIGLSSHISKLMLIYTELMRVGNLNYAVIGVTTGAPVLAVLCSHLAYLSAEWPVRHWWLETGSPFFYMFVASAALLVVLFLLLSCSVTRRLSALRAAKLSSSEAAGLDSRSGLVCRASTLFVASAAMLASSLVFVNVPGDGGGSAGPGPGPIAFGSSAAALGLLIVFCYAVRPEAPCGPGRSSPRHGKAKEAAKEDDGSLTFFTKQDANAESEGGAPLDLIRESGHVLQQAQGPAPQPMEAVGVGAVWGPYEGAYRMQDGIATRVCVELIGEEVVAGGVPAVMRCNLEPGVVAAGPGPGPCIVGPIMGEAYSAGPGVLSIATPDGTTYTTTSFVIGDPMPVVAPPSIAALPVITVTRTDQEPPPAAQDADMLNRISQDLDYLLNRTPPPGQVAPGPGAPPPVLAPAPTPTPPPAIVHPVSILRRRPSCTMTIQEAVQEEEEEEAEAEGKGNLVVA